MKALSYVLIVIGILLAVLGVLGRIAVNLGVIGFEVLPTGNRLPAILVGFGLLIVGIWVMRFRRS